MSTRKSSTTPVTAASSTPPESVAALASTTSSTSKSDNSASPTNISSSTTVATASGEEKAEMGSNASAVSGGGVGEQGEADSAVASNKDVSKSDSKQLCNEPKRITRNSPLLLASPTLSASGGRKDHRSTDGIDSELTNSEGEESVGSSRRPTQIRGRKSLKEAKENTDKDKIKSAESIEADKSDKVNKETDSIDIKEAKSNKESETPIECVPPSTADSDTQLSSADTNNSNATNSTTATATTTTVTVNRLTRKAVAQELAANTRVTRNRQTSTNRPETPPSTASQTTTATRSRRSNAGRKMPLPMADSVAKRRRPDDESMLAEPTGSKLVKVEVKDESEVTEDELPPPASGNLTCNDSEVKIKQELIESDESATEAIVTASTRGRSRWSVRKSQQASLQSSPSTRATRYSKNASPSPSPTTSSASSTSGGGPTESKRRRYAPSNTLTRSSSMSLLKTAAAGNTNGIPLHVPDEDSKDSMASSSIDELLMTDIKVPTDLADETNLSMEVDDKSALSATAGISEPLKVETEPSVKEPPAASSAHENGTTAVKASTSLGITESNTRISDSSEKAASLSPEMISEGVSEISVKQFYKKPEFLENNLGIEEDPKLGGIVQKVTIEKEISDVTVNEATAPADKAECKQINTTSTKQSDKESVNTLSNEDDDLEEGTLRLDYSKEEKKGSMNDDTNSLDAVNFSPLIVEEDEDFETVEDINTKAVNNTDDDNICKADAINEKEEADALDDDITMEESETISMDNNPSVNEEISENARDELEDEIEEIEHDAEVALKDVECEKTNTECDSKQAKLNIETKEHDTAVSQVKLIEDEQNEDSNGTDQKKAISGTSANKSKVATEVDGTGCSNLPNASKKSEGNDGNSKVHEDGIVEAALENIEDDELVIKIDAELNRYRELEKGKHNDKEKSKVNIVDSKAIIVSTESLKSFDAMDTEENDKVDPKTEGKKESDKVNNLLLESNLECAKDDADEKNFPKSEETTNKPVVAAGSISISNSNALISKKDDVVTPIKTGTIKLEDFEKEQHLQNLGLLTHKAAEKRRQEYIQSSAAAVEASRTQQQQNQSNNGSSGKRNGKAASASVSHEYTGTLKTVIKINRNCNGGHTSSAGNATSSGRKSSSNNNSHNQHATSISGSTVVATSSKEGANGSGNTMRRQSLKITFQKGRARGQGHNDRATDQHNQDEDAYYTIQNENEEAQKASSSGTTAEHSNTQTHGRKSYNRSNTTSHSASSATIEFSDSESHEHTHYTTLSASNKILIPEKASSFKFHPDRLCDDQCFYCGGKFGLYDTPCHVGQIKFMERQQKILANEEKLTVDSCLCEACFRHVDRRANVPSYKKRLSATGHLEGTTTATGESADGSMEGEEDTQPHKCVVPDCANPAVHSLRRKCIKKSVKKFLHSFGTPPTPCVWLCQAHYATVMQCSGCVLCKRRLGKNHMYHITSDTDRLEKALTEMGIPVQLGIGTAVCKLCRYFANLLMKPRDGKSPKETFLKSYRKRLLQFHNIHNDSNEGSEVDDDDGGATSTGLATDTTNNMKTAQKSDNKEMRANKNSTPSKELPSPAGSTGSSVECLGETTTLAAEGSAESEKHQHNQAQQQVMIDNDVLVDYDAPMVSTDSNSSSAPMSPRSDSAPGKQQMSKLKAILQSSSTNSASNGANQSKSGSSSSSTADISNVLRANPNISMRELFPGEEDLGLHFKAPFGNSSSQRTPEGWTRVQTFLQYDEATRRLWEELQKPYGNQSSFLRHLILLEKYFRNGDLVLSPNASSNASVYTQTVRQRLTSYDQGHCGGLVNAKPIAHVEKNSSAEIPTVEINEDDDEESHGELNANDRQMDVDYPADETRSRHSKRSRSISVDKLTKQLSTNAVTIIARPKQQQQQQSDLSPQKSLLKEKASEVGNNLHNTASASSTTLTAISGSNVSGNNNSIVSNSRSILKTNLLGMNKSVEILPISSSSNAGSSSSSTSVGAGKAHNVTTESKQQKILEVANKLLGNQLEAVAAAAAEAQAQSKGSATSLLTSPPELVSLQRRSLGVTGNVVQSATSNATAAPTIPSALTTSLINNKRAHVMPKGASGSSGNVSTHRAAPPNVVILPESLTPQERLQSKSWRPTLMPVGENQHLLNKDGPLYQTADGRRLPALVQVQSGGKPFLISIFDYNRMCILRREKLLRDQMLKVGKNRHETKQQQHQQQQQQQQHHHQQHHHQHQQHQKGISAATLPNLNKNASRQQQQHHQQQHQQQQQQQQHIAERQLLQLMQFQKQQQSAMKAGRYQHIAPKPPASSHSSSSSASSSITTTSSTMAAGNATSSANAFPGPMMPLLANALPGPAVNPKAGGIGNSSWLWNNFPDANMLLNGNLAQNAPKLPQLLHKTPVLNATNTPATLTSSQHQMLLDNALMSKIPKSLTVIPQHKLMNAAAAAAAAANNSVGNMSHKE